MYKITAKILLPLIRFVFDLGVSRSTTLPDKILLEITEEWIEENLAHREPKNNARYL